MEEDKEMDIKVATKILIDNLKITRQMLFDYNVVYEENIHGRLQQDLWKTAEYLQLLIEKLKEA